MAENIQTLTGPAAKVAAFVNTAIARIRSEAQTAVDSAVTRARDDIDRIAREAADSALAEARAASSEAQQARSAMATMQSEMNATRDEIRAMLDELRARQAEHDAMFASFDDLDGDGVPDAASEPSRALTVSAPVEVVAPNFPPHVVDLSDLREMIREIVEARLSIGDGESSGRITGGSTYLMWVNGKTLDKYEERIGDLEAITDAMLREFFAEGTEFATDEDGQQVEVSVSAFYRLGVETYPDARRALLAGAKAKREKLAAEAERLRLASEGA